MWIKPMIIISCRGSFIFTCTHILELRRQHVMFVLLFVYCLLVLTSWCTLCGLSLQVKTSLRWKLRSPRKQLSLWKTLSFVFLWQKCRLLSYKKETNKKTFLPCKAGICEIVEGIPTPRNALLSLYPQNNDKWQPAKIISKCWCLGNRW